MLDFIYKLNDTLPTWQRTSQLSLKQIAEVTETDLPHVVQYLTEGLGREIDVTSMLSIDEATEAVVTLSRKLRPEIEEREAQLSKKREETVASYDCLLDRVSEMEIEGNWHGAFRTLSYFAGQHEDILPRDLLINLCSSTIRAGIRASASMLELGQWLQKGVAVALSYRTREGIEEALDLIDAYFEDFINDTNQKGKKILSDILSVLEGPSAHFELWEEYKTVVNCLYPPPPSSPTSPTSI